MAPISKKGIKPPPAYQQGEAYSQQASLYNNYTQQNMLAQANQQMQNYANQQALMDGLNALKRAQEEAKRREEKPPEAPPGRTREEIIWQLEARYVELEREANDPKRLYPCETCKWRGVSQYRCKQPLMQGYGEQPLNYDHDPTGKLAKLCGAEKALWEEKIVLTWWQRLLLWLGKPTE